MTVRQFEQHSQRPFIEFGYLRVGERFRFPASDDVNTKLERPGWYAKPDGTHASATYSRMVIPLP